jgi:hypothetical protein
MEAAPNGMPLIAGVAKVKKHFKLKKSPAVPPISTLQAPPAAEAPKAKKRFVLKKTPAAPSLAPMAFRGGAQKEEIPEREAEAPKVLNAARDISPDEDISDSIFDTPWLYSRNPKDGYDPEPFLIMAGEILLSAVAAAATHMKIGYGSQGLAKLSDMLMVNYSVKEVIQFMSDRSGPYNGAAKTIMKHQKKYFKEAGFWQTNPVLGEGPGVFSSVQVDFGEKDEIGGRIGIRWHPVSGEKDAGWKRDAAGKAWWGEIKLSMTYNLNRKKFEWSAHVRCEWDSADDWETSQERVDRELNKLIKENPADWSPKYYARHAAEALEVVDAVAKKVVIEKKTKEQAIKEVLELLKKK